VDVSPEMLGVARRRFADETERFELRVVDYAREPLAGEYEVVISALSIHHLDWSGKRELFRKIYGTLCAGGVFVNADQVLGSTPEIEARYREMWLCQVRERGVGEEDLAAALVRMGEDKPSTLEEQTAWLEEAGFWQVDCPYKNYSFAVYGGRKPR
jgi:tRNA (cmo5U34)-methyltransferase